MNKNWREQISFIMFSTQGRINFGRINLYWLSCVKVSVIEVQNLFEQASKYLKNMLR